jgi:hypothetical protein
VAPGGLLFLSGILRTQGPEIRAGLGWHGLVQVAEERQEEWLCVIARRGADSADQLPGAGHVLHCASAGR